MDARDTLRPKHERNEFTADENTAYTGLNLPARRAPCWRRIRSA